MHGMVGALVMFCQIVNLRMTVVARRNTVLRLGLHNLFEFSFAVIATRFRITGLQKTAAPTTTVIIGSVGAHIDEVRFSHDGFNHHAKIFGHRIPQRFTNQLAKVLNGEFYTQVIIPAGVNVQFSFAYPLGIVFDNGSNLEIVLDIELVQSDPD